MVNKMKDYYGDELKTFIIEVELNHETRYVRTKNVAIYSKDIARKFAHKKSAKRFYKGSIFDKLNCNWRVIELNYSENDFS
jgi:hypothetical protein